MHLLKIIKNQREKAHAACNSSTLTEAKKIELDRKLALSFTFAESWGKLYCKDEDGIAGVNKMWVAWQAIQEALNEKRNEETIKTQGIFLAIRDKEGKPLCTFILDPDKN